jgi:HK97 family phage prohead protease
MAKKFILSDSSKTNTRGFKIDLSGLDLARFNANPVMLYLHEHEKLIGRWENIALEDGKLTAVPVFDTDDALGKEISGKVERGFLRGCSIGIIIRRIEETGNDVTVTESELLEASIVPVPADAGAVVLYDDDRQIITLNQAKLNIQFIKQTKTKTKTMEKEKFELPQSTLVSLGITGDLTPKSVETAVAEKDRRIDELQAKVKKQESDAVEAYLSGAVKAGKIKEAEKPAFLKLASADLDSVKAVIDARPEQASISLADMTKKTTIAAVRDDWNYIRWMKDDPDGLKKLKAENPNEFERLKTTFK